MSYNTLFENLASDVNSSNDVATDKLIKNIEDEYKNLKSDPQLIELNNRLITLKRKLNATKNNKNVYKSKLNDDLAIKRKQIRKEMQEILARIEELKK